jgi:hypothetical protein
MGARLSANTTILRADMRPVRHTPSSLQGLAPMCGFMQERAALLQGGAQLGPALLFFGCRSAGEDYIYRDTLEGHLAAGVISGLHVAFSRDGPSKVYVQVGWSMGVGGWRHEQGQGAAVFSWGTTGLGGGGCFPRQSAEAVGAIEASCLPPCSAAKLSVLYSVCLLCSQLQCSAAVLLVGPLAPVFVSLSHPNLILLLTPPKPIPRPTRHQDLVEAQGREVWALLEAGAHMYVCGDARRMAPDVRRAFMAVARDQGGRSEASAQNWMGSLLEAGRYLEDVWAG